MLCTPLQAWVEAKIGCAPGAFNRETLQTYQLNKIRETLRLAQQFSPFYRRHLAGLNPDLPDLAALSTLPFCSADDIRREGIQFLCVSQDEIQRVVSLNTSGTSGEPKRLFFTPADQNLTIDFFGVGMSTLVSRGERVLILLPGEKKGSVGDLLFEGLKQTGVMPFKHGPVVDVISTLNRIKNEPIDVLVGVPVQVLALARVCGALDEGAVPQIKSVLLSTDYVPGAVVDAIRDAWHCPVFNHYGMTEMGLGGGVTCAAQMGYHLREADLYFEIIDPLSGKVLQDGQEGEVVFTTLTRRGMPLVRYRTGDISRFINQPCACGSRLKLMQVIRDRIDSRIQLLENRLSIADLDDVLLAEPQVWDYEATLKHGASGDSLELQVYVNQTRADIKSRLRGRLESVQVINRLLQQNPHGLNIKIQEGLPPFLGRMNKRRIMETVV
ncbi:MAG: AMP-binding protein [Anaerolineae bacterium]|nr:AMP-binding protein [Anaerolineae bacterium]